jgi:mannose-6-phosphate isomerase-like protein (cupin superfamily)
MIDLRRVQDVEDTPNPHGVSARKIHDSEEAQIVHIHLRPGESLRRHATPVDVCFYVLEGQGRIHVGEEHVEAAPDTLVESPARIPHWLENPTDGDFRVLVIKTPRPKSKSRLL